AAHHGCADVRLLGRVGTDSAAWHERELRASGVRPRLVVDPEAATGTVICLVDTGAAAERTFLTDSGAALRLDPDDWSPSLLDGVARLHLSGYLFFAESSRALVAVALESARARGVPVSVDPASAGFLTRFGDLLLVTPLVARTRAREVGDAFARLDVPAAHDRRAHGRGRRGDGGHDPEHRRPGEQPWPEGADERDACDRRGGQQPVQRR
uniref:carbohydrate kinase family protein n=1 Tax=Streptomyces caniscabiei TaxID=2746961 RepID=UPI000AD6C531